MKRKEERGQDKRGGIGGSKWKKTEKYRKGKRRQKIQEGKRIEKVL